MSDDDTLKDAREAFELAAEAEAENRRDALDDLRFARLGEQWPEAIRRERDLDGRPCLTINR
uniref:portal protein n=1 Tax=Phenylobacterium sp. TaxID=1871053 RepID=UPI0039837653